MVVIDKSYMLTASEAARVTYGRTNSKKYLTVHTTDNKASTATALNHAKLQKNGNSRQASWHYQVDDIKAYQSLDNAYSAWHAGNANQQSIAVEICVNAGADWNKTMRNAVELIAKIMRDEKIPLSRLKQHNYFTGKHCPRDIREGRGGWTWNKVVDEVGKLLSGNAQKTQKPSKPSKPSGIGTVKTLVDSLNYYDGPRWTAPAGTVKKGTVLTVVAKVAVAGAYQYKTVSGTYVTASSKYVKFSAK